MSETDTEKKSWNQFEAEGYFKIVCPTCGQEVTIDKDQINCRIFVHGVLKGVGQVDQHASAEYLNELRKTPEKYQGCLGRFKFDGVNDPERLD